MQAAPPVAVRCTAGWAWRSVQAALPALAAAAVTFWALSTWADASRLAGIGLAALSALLAGCVAWRHSSRPACTLEWDGQRWAVNGRPGELQLMIDLRRAMLLRHGGRRWLYADRDAVGAAWHGLRVAVHARTAPAAPDDGLLNA